MRDEANRRLQRHAELDAMAETRWMSMVVFQSITLLQRAIAWVLKRPAPTSARATLAARRRRDHVPELVQDPELTGTRPGAFESAGEDPETLDAEGLVRWFGATMHD